MKVIVPVSANFPGRTNACLKSEGLCHLCGLDSLTGTDPKCELRTLTSFNAPDELTVVVLCSLFLSLQVNIDHQTTKEIIENMKSPDCDTFTKGQQSIYLLMARDSFVRFVKSEPFQAALRR